MRRSANTLGDHSPVATRGSSFLGFAQSDSIDGYRDASVLQHIGIPWREVFQS
jgi:hypothetical protein